MSRARRKPHPPPKVGNVSLGCPKALVDSERVLAYPDLLAVTGPQHIKLTPRQHEDVAGAAANDLSGHVPDAVAEARWDRFMQAQQAISARKLARRIGATIEVLVDGKDEYGTFGRSKADAPEIDGTVRLDGFGELAPGSLVAATEAGAYDLRARPGGGR